MGEGKTLNADKRRREALMVARRDGSVDVATLAADLSVSPETVRRDLRVLADLGLVRRTHGGAHPVESAGFETTLATRATRHVPQKTRIAAAAAELLGEAVTVFIDEGFTPQLIAQALPQDRRLTIVTTSLTTAAVMAERDHAQVLLLGGRVRGTTMATVDQWAKEMMAGFVIDLAYVGANGISREHGLTTPDPAVGQVKAQAVKSARRRILVGIHTKFGAVSFCRFAEVRELEAIITDTSLSATEAQRYSLLGPQVIRV
ncbi:DeoR/GlpR transcriptional regulator [Streptomyces lunaelactis]|nr:DeoR/GlpR family DNA-binding transcription regulator [Streptomyces lunaelactis]NUK72861.1 DeoR/GlpR transcriptional regulator [Streptomyces lunaelactis]NUK80344.1 DeoR/GlpR transcriptional regulator [Streptomyces lunaelactis]